jgi:hypothetical protein
MNSDDELQLFQPGQLITAADLNALVRAVCDLRARVAWLEGGNPAAGGAVARRAPPPAGDQVGGADAGG